MFGIDFYPTPANVVDRMLAGVETAGKFVLEPSAGSGNIVDVLNVRGAKVTACEIDENLRKVLSGKCTVIGDDFLELTSEKTSHIDLIIMNPPFSDSEQHILHAYEIAPEGCEIISLCNYETIRNPWNEKRQKIKELIDKCGMHEYYGDCFSNADRKTDCSISCIHLWKPKTGASEFSDYFDYEPDEDIMSGQAGLIPYNSIREIVNRYVAAVSGFDKVMEESRKINELTCVFASCPIKFGAYHRDKSYQNVISRDEFKKELQISAWKEIFSRMNMDKYVTKSVREDINRFVQRQVNFPFTMRNIFRMLELIVGTHANRMQKTLVEAFEKICSFSDENSTAGEKWKTNSDYMVNRRFIVPFITRYDSRWPSHHVEIGWSGHTEDIEDIIRALCYLTGTPYENTCGLREFFNEFKIPWGQWKPMGFFRYSEGKEPVYLPGFFKVRGYKKGTLHFEFIDEEVWTKFNRTVAEIKGWRLPRHAKKRKA